MKVGEITTTNAKGQVVIPKKMRDQLGLTPQSVLNIVLWDNGIFITPITGITTKVDSDDSSAEILKRTQGSWGPPSEEEEKMEEKRRRLEINASGRRKYW